MASAVRCLFGLQLLPFAGIAFLWFIGVLRDRIGPGGRPVLRHRLPGQRADLRRHVLRRGAVAAGLVDTAAEPGGGDGGATVWPVGREIGHTLMTVYGLRMAAVFAISATTLASRLPARASVARRPRLRDCARPAPRGGFRAVARSRLPGVGVRDQCPHPGPRSPPRQGPPDLSVARRARAECDAS